MASNEDTPSRFWEFYALRYSVGAVLGALILFFLVKQNNSLSDLIFIKKDDPIDLIQVGVFLVLGLVYSYLASAPILVFHAGRFLLPKRRTSIFESSGRSLALFLTANITAGIVFFMMSSLATEPRIWLSLIIFAACSVLSGQLFILTKCQSQRAKLFEFYKLLALNRSHAKGGFVESYKHLREHANAYGIVFFEMMLAVFMFAATTFSSFVYGVSNSAPYETAALLAVVILAWITPASLVWLVACTIEQDFADS
jgi:hypothetical protein